MFYTPCTQAPVQAETSTYLAVVLGQWGMLQMQTAANNDVLETNLTYLKTIMGKTV